MRPHYKILQVVRDVYGTGGGNIAINTSLKFLETGCEVVLLSDQKKNNAILGDLTIITIPFGPALSAWRVNGKFSRTLRHFFQISFFNIFSVPYILYFYYKGYIVVNHNNEAIWGAVVCVHNVFSAEVFSYKRNWLRLLNPITLIRVLKEQLILRFCTSSLIVANSRQTEFELNKHLTSAFHCVVIPSGVNREKFFFSRERPDFSGNFKLLFVGHEFERKGLSFVIESLKFLPLECVLVVVGGRGSDVSRYHDLIDSLGLKSRVEFLGTTTDLAQIYSSSHVFVLPSSYEGLPLVCLEAMASGLPNIVTKIGGMADLVVDNHNGFFVDQDPKSISEKILILFEDRCRYQLMSDRAIESTKRYSWSRISEEYLKVFSLLEP